MEKVVIILGPTAVGKSDIGIELAKKFNGEIISADSVQIYRGLDIGSAKITKEEMQGVLHHCIDILPPQSEFTVYDYVTLTKQKISEISAKGKLPFIVGGTGLYVRALLGGYDFGGTGKQTEFREKLEKEAEENLGKLYSELQQKDPERAGKIKSTDKKRIIRALEIAKYGSEPRSEEVELDALVINLTMDREKLYERINYRAEVMFKNGLIREVKRLLSEGVTKDSQSMRAIGYKEVISFLDGEFDENRVIELTKQHSRNYAKRQMTFFRSLKDAVVIEADEKMEAIAKAEKLIKEWLK